MVMEFKSNEGAIDLGNERPAYESFLHSPEKGIEILENDEASCNISDYIMHTTGITSWVENV